MTIQERWDQTFSRLDRSCPAQRADEAPVDYPRRLSRIGRRYIPKGEEIASVNFAELPDNVVGKFSEMMRAAVERNIMRTDNMQPGEMRAVMVVDEQTGMQHRHFIGPDSFVKAMGQPCRRVVGGFFQSDVTRLKQQQGIPASETRYNTFGNSKGHDRFFDKGSAALVVGGTAARGLSRAVEGAGGGNAPSAIGAGKLRRR
jgi:hypothetical protein